MATSTNGVLRDRPRINVTRGYTGNEPGNITVSTALDGGTLDNSSIAKTVYSGQPVELNSSGKWKKASNASAATSVHFAYHDSTDTDVESCGKLLGFSALGNFEIESAWVDTNGLVVGDQLGVKLDSSQHTQSVLAKQGASTGAAVGVVTEIRDLGVGGHSALGSAGVQRGGVPGTIPEDSTANGWGSAGGAAGQVAACTLTGENNAEYTVTITLPSGHSVTTAKQTGTNNANTDASTLNTALGALINADPLMDAAIISNAVNNNIITITSHDGLANAVVVTLDRTAGSTAAIVQVNSTPAADATASNSMNIVKFVTNV